VAPSLDRRRGGRSSSSHALFVSTVTQTSPGLVIENSPPPGLGGDGLHEGEAGQVSPHVRRHPVSFLRRPSRRVIVGSLLLLTAITLPVEAVAAQLQVTWTNNSTNEDGFKIERSIGTTGTFVQIGVTGPDVTSYTDSGLANVTAYCYRVRAYNAAGDSDYSNVSCATTPQNFTLAVVRFGTGNGTVTTSPPGITCGTSCSESYPTGTALTLTVGPVTGSTFTGWSGAGCTG